jgi:hypothetical protein
MIQGHPVLNQDPQMRAKVLPVFQFDPNSPAERPIGLGTAFRIDPWGNCATAFHVVEQAIELDGGDAVLKSNVRLVALEIEGIVYGSPPIPPEAWRPLVDMYARCGAEASPLLHQKPELRNVTELACLTFSRSHERTPMPYLPTALGFQTPKVGDVLTGYGFAGLDVGKEEDRPMTQYLYESTGQVIEVLPCDPTSSKPWPRLRVSAEWPSGMSGGPVINAEGTVVGVISQGWTGEADSTATFFAGWTASRATFATLDPSAVRRFRAFAAMTAAGEVRFLGQDQNEAEAFAASEGLTVLPVSCSPDTGDWIAL